LHHVMFDVDGTLVMSDEFDGNCYLEAVHEVLGHSLDTDWRKYTYVSDAGILDQHIRESGLDDRKEKIFADVKAAFIEKISNHLKDHPVQQVSGASEFLFELRQTEHLTLSIATGGWHETALMKLEAADIDVGDIPIASSNNHYARSEIMKIAKAKAVGHNEVPCTYFGDGEWDKIACQELGFNFVLIGEKTYHHQNIKDFINARQAMAFIGL